MNLQSVIFDLDGTVVADEDEYGEAFNRVLESLGVERYSSYPHIGGIGVEENWVVFLKKHKIKTRKTSKELALMTQKEYLTLLDDVTLKDGFSEFSDELKKNGIKIALATSNDYSVADEIISKLALEKTFDVVTTAEEVLYKKPDPEIYTITADKLRTEREHCLVIEDSESGIDAALDAGMKVVGIFRNEEHKKTLKKANLLISNYFALDYSKLLSL